MKRVCDNVRELYVAAAKADRSLTMAVFADACGAGYATVNGWVNGKNCPQCALIPAIAKFFHVPIARLFEGVE